MNNPDQKKLIEAQIKAYEACIGTESMTMPVRDSVLQLEIEPFVANPQIMNSGRELVTYMASRPELVADKIVVDMGTGCGIIGIAAALLGARRVYMSDIDRKSVENARSNCALNNVTAKCDVFQSDLFQKYGKLEPADLQIFNYPFYCGDPVKGKEWTRMMLGSTELIDRYFKDAPLYSKKEAVYLVPWLTVAESLDEVPDNRPLVRSGKFGYSLARETKWKPDAYGLQRSAFIMYELQRKPR